MKITPEIIERYKRFEGYASHFYLDELGNVTIGIGCLITTPEGAAKLNLLHKEDNSKATIEEIIKEYLEIKIKQPGHTEEYYGVFCDLYLPEEFILRLFNFRLLDKLEILKFQFKEFDQMPEAVQDILLDMAYNLGVTGLMLKFPRFIEAIRHKRWASAIVESERANTQIERNEWVKAELFKVESESNNVSS